MNARTGIGRRRFLGRVAAQGMLAALGAAALAGYSRGAASLPPAAIRPPGAGAEADFLGACVRCGLCVRACPFDTLRLSALGEAVSLGTPYFVAREVPCEMCDDIPCVAACPTGALDPQLNDIDDARMGLAVLIDQETCLAFLGLRCEVCFQVCPLMGKAIKLDRSHNARSTKHAFFRPVVMSDACTGCGKCEKSCVLEVAAIKVLPRQVAKGVLGAHYRVGWEEKRKAGGALVTPDTEHRYHLPQGLDYDHGGKGLHSTGEVARP